MVMLNMPRDVTLKFSGAFFDHDQIPHPTDRDKDGKPVYVANPLSNFRGMELKLFRGINNVVDDIAFDPRIRRFIVDPASAEAKPQAPRPPAVATEPVRDTSVVLAPGQQDPTAQMQQTANRDAKGQPVDLPKDDDKAKK